MAKSTTITCAVDGCPKPSRSRGMCHGHYKQWLYANSPRRCAFDGCDHHVQAKGYCATHYARIWKYGDVQTVNRPGKKPLDPAERFWSHVEKTEGCWIWKGTRNTGGYGSFWNGERNVMAHRYAWELEHGPITDPMLHVGHNCPGGDNPSCIRPSHMILLTPAEHGLDKKAKGQTTTGDRNGSRLHPERILRGLQHPHITMTPLQAQAVYYLKDHFSSIQIAAMFSLNQSTVLRCIKDRWWEQVLSRDCKSSLFCPD